MKDIEHILAYFSEKTLYSLGLVWGLEGVRAWCTKTSFYLLPPPPKKNGAWCSFFVRCLHNCHLPVGSHFNFTKVCLESEIEIIQNLAEF